MTAQLHWQHALWGGVQGCFCPTSAGLSATMCAVPILEGSFQSCAACRSDEERERDGTPALTAGALGRGAAVPLPYISGPLSRNVRNADELAYQIAATVATGLVQVMLKGIHLETSS